MNSQFSQIFLKSTSSMSLDERFTMMMQNQQDPLVDIRDAAPQPLRASRKNQLLAQQMANRPSVLAALQNNLNLKRHQVKGGVKARIGRSMMRGGLCEMSRSWEIPRGRGVLQRGALSQTLTDRGLIQQYHGAFINRGRLTQSRGVRGTHRGRGMMFVGCGSADRSARTGSCSLPTREELDAQLDDYMSMSKSHLDAQLDAYMAEVDSTVKDLL